MYYALCNYSIVLGYSFPFFNFSFGSFCDGCPNLPDLIMSSLLMSLSKAAFISVKVIFNLYFLFLICFRILACVTCLFSHVVHFFVRTNSVLVISDSPSDNARSLPYQSGSEVYSVSSDIFPLLSCHVLFFSCKLGMMY